MFSDYITKLLQEVAPDSPVKFAQGQTSFSLEVEGTPLLIVDTSPGIRIDAKIGKLPKELPDRFMAKMLQGNFLGQLTRRAVLGLNEAGTDIVLSLNLPIVRNYREFHDNLEDYINTLSFWKEALARHPKE